MTAVGKRRAHRLEGSRFAGRQLYALAAGGSSPKGRATRR
jgi:hypothetical protein